MPIKTCACVTIDCDRCDEGWEDGSFHFASEDDATSYVRSCGWLVTDGLILCAACAKRADCARTGHDWDAWRDREMKGFPYRSRWCEHCEAVEHDPPWDAMTALYEAAEVVDAAAGES